MITSLIKEINPKHHTILIVDDNQTNLKVIVNYLREFGFKLLMADSGENCLKIIERRQPDLILLDIMMPDINGFEVCRRLQANEATSKIPIIFMTALANENDKVRGFDVGAVDYITKPIQQQEVLARVITHLKIQAQAKQLQYQNNALLTQNAIATTISQSLDLNVMLEKVLDKLLQVLKMDGGTIDIINFDSNIMEVQTHRGLSDELISAIKYLNVGEGIVGQVMRTGKPTVIDMLDYPIKQLIPLFTANGFKKLVCTPLISKGQALGGLTLNTRQDRSFSEQELQLLASIGQQIGVSIENRQLYQLIQQTNKELSQLNADKDKFFSIVAHDLRGPFTPLFKTTKQLSQITKPIPLQDLKVIGKTLYNSANSVFNLLENLLHWSRFQRGRMPYLPTKLNLTQILEQNVAFLAETAVNKQITLQNNLKTRIWVQADENMLNMVIRNLINNALKFTHSGGQVILSARPSKQANMVTVTVADTGVGIAKADTEKLFKIDQHHSTLGTAQEQGTGLGLIMCYEMVNKHGGKIWVESTLGEGSTFLFTIPITEPLPESNWLCSNLDTDSTFSEVSESNFNDLIAPPIEELQKLHYLAERGNMRKIRYWIKDIMAMDEKYHPFAQQVNVFTQMFDGPSILNLLKEHINI